MIINNKNKDLLLSPAAGCVTQTTYPSLLHNLPLQEVHSYGLLVVLGEDTLAVALDHARLAHRSVSHHDHLDGHFHVLLQHGGKITIRPIPSNPLCLVGFGKAMRTHRPPETAKQRTVTGPNMITDRMEISILLEVYRLCM